MYWSFDRLLTRAVQCCAPCQHGTATVRERTRLHTPALLFLLTAPLFSQSVQPGTREFGVWAGFAPATATLIGTTPDRQLALLGLRFGYFFGRSGPVTFEYTADFLPVAVMLDTGSRSPVYGFAWAPLGLKVHFGSRRLSPFLASTAGMIYTTEPVPIAAPDATRLNFMFDFGGGVQWFARSRRSVFFGYKLHHISNAGRSSFNPGLDSQMLFAGFSFVR